MTICERGDWILYRVQPDHPRAHRLSVDIAHDCEARAIACRPGGIIFLPFVLNSECRYCGEKAPVDMEAMYLVGNL